MSATMHEDRQASPPTAPRASDLLIDQFLPRYDLAIVHAGVFRAPPEACYGAARGLDLLRAPLIRALVDLRAVPQRLADRLAGRRNRGSAPAPAPTFRLDDMGRPPINWMLLGEEPRVELVLGQIGRHWQPTGMGSVPAVAPTDFVAFDRATSRTIPLVRLVPSRMEG